MDTSLALTALLMGLAGGPHCAAMCGAACGALGGGRGARQAQGAALLIPIRLVEADSPGSPRSVQAALPPATAAVSPAQWLFQLGRLLSYSALGAVAAGSMQAVGWLSLQAASLRPLWVFVHVAAMALGLMLLWRARQPVWLEEGARRLWRRVLSLLPGRAGGAAPLLMGLAWAFLPCGLLYSALLVAALSPGLWQGAGVMALFALGSGISLLAAPWLWGRLRGAGSGELAVRLAGAALVATSSWALWHALVHDAAPWCVTSA